MSSCCCTSSWKTKKRFYIVGTFSAGFYAASKEDEDYAYIELAFETVLGRGPRVRRSYIWFEIGTMYFTSLSFYPADLLVAACTTCAGFDKSSGRRATRWSQLFFKLPPVSGLGYESDTRLNSSFPSNENWGSDGQGRKFVSCHRGWKTTLADKNVFFSLLNLSRHVLRTMTVQWFKKQTCLVCQNLEACDAGYRHLWRLAKFCSLGPKYVIYKTPH